MTTNSSRKILGVDPGSRVTGYGIIITEGPRLDFVSCGTIRTKQGATFAQRLLEIYEGLTEVIERHQPQEAAVEEMFVARNPNTALKLGQARGVAVLAAMRAGLSVHDYAVRVIKQAVVGYGQADKSQVQHMIRVLLGLSATPSSDAADALAAAICHAHHLKV